MNITTTPTEAHFSYAGFQKISPAALAALLEMGKAVDDSGLEKTLTELVKIRVSQINGCAFCIQFHLQIARRIGIDAIKLDLVAAWRDVDVYSARELAALEWAEEVTRLADHHS
ncbi:MAG: carboxymuconolactone decarboxylase family protein, partial [Acinetobacter sp.]